MGIGARRRSRGDLEGAVLAVLRDARTPLTPAEVREILGGELAYTTVMTVLGRLHAKAAVIREARGRGYAYSAIHDPAERTARQMEHLLSYEADRASVLTRFVDVLSSEDEATLRALLDATDPELR